MAEKLYPTFEIPSVVENEITDGVYADEYFWPGPHFDFEKGDFVRDGANQVIMVDGYNEYMLWVMKCIRTQIGTCESYPDFGIDLEGSITEPTYEGIASALEKTITEALMRNPRTDSINTFQITVDADEIEVFFIVEPKDLEAFTISMSVVK